MHLRTNSQASLGLSVYLQKFLLKVLIIIDTSIYILFLFINEWNEGVHMHPVCPWICPWYTHAHTWSSPWSLLISKFLSCTSESFSWSWASFSWSSTLSCSSLSLCFLTCWLCLSSFSLSWVFSCWIVVLSASSVSCSLAMSTYISSRLDGHQLSMLRYVETGLDDKLDSKPILQMNRNARE